LQIKADNPGIAFGEVAKIGSEMWKAADEDTKAKYEKMARDDKARYMEQKKEYDAKKAAEAGAADAGDVSDVADD
jgi:HMG (high mobility group) box